MSSFLSQTCFELFSLPQQYALDEAELAARYRDLQRTVHPDRYASASDQERRMSMQQATRINEAYEILGDPMKRGRYLLELRGYPPGDQQQTASDPAFLMQQMELREELERVNDASDPMAALDHFAGEIRNQSRLLEQALAEALDGQPADNEKALEIVLKMQFYTRLRNEVQELEADLEDELY
jgi:molecular chaperone HscB